VILGIDASNIRAGGGVTHLVELLRVADPYKHGFKKVIVWGCLSTLSKIENRNWLFKESDPLLERQLPYRIFWQLFKLDRLARQSDCDVLFVPGGTAPNGFKPMITMSQNLLPFEWREMRRYGWSLYTLKFLLLRWTQSHSFSKANGVIFLTKYARDAVMKVIGFQRGINAIIPHGINPRFSLLPRSQRLLNEFTVNQPCRVLYVSIIDVYKHQWHVAEATAILRSSGIPVQLELIGPPATGMSRLKETLNRVDPNGTFIKYRGEVPYEKLHEFYAGADICVFASSCENLPNILLEGMVSGLPIACSKMGPMPEVLGYSGIYFNPEDSSDIARALRELIESPKLRVRLAQAAFERVGAFSWQKCSDETFGFLATVTQTNMD
jgi:glycosyltransferase involved in cell wall biosynthesis